jgi:phosphatidylglycerol:prolipoprotein diacylglycerol transferase
LGTLTAVPIGVITFEFDPVLHLLGTFTVRWQTLAIAAVIAISIVVATLVARRAALRADDLLFITVGVVPGALIGGRLEYAATHWGAFAQDPMSLLDPARSGLGLAGAVIGGTISGAYVASLLGEPIGRWAHILALPVLFVLGAGKLAMVLGGTGQGLPSVEPWATAYLGPGPWGSLAPELPSHPSQAYEGLGTLAWLVLLAAAVWVLAFERRDGRLFLVAILGWAVVRAAVSTTWRDPALVGPLPAGGVFAIASSGLCLAALVGAAVAGRVRRPTADGRGATTDEESGAEPAWPDPATRPRF